MKKRIASRKQIRLPYYDYTKEGMYFITICTKNRLKLFGNMKNNQKLELTREGSIAKQYLEKIEMIFKNVLIDEYIIMPNHIHMLLIINNKKDITISRIIKQYKMYVSKQIKYSIWQKSFYEHIVRNELEYQRIKTYIQNNVINWKQDIYC